MIIFSRVRDKASLDKSLELRKKVFVVEQRVPEDRELDEYDNPERLDKDVFHFKPKKIGTPGRIRTRDPLVRSEMLCPAELRAHIQWGERRDSNPRSSGPQPDVLTCYTTPTI
tara:strand:+ start:446 stop:784 length:339 start_codon:yes stop_codon:yes gene_type:complete